MSKSYEDMIDELERGHSSETLSESSLGPEIHADTMETAAEAMSFVLSLHRMFIDQGARLEDTPDVNILESLIDAYNGELAAACMFFTDPRMANVPDILRGTAATLQEAQEDGEDSVPTVIIKGYERLANRIENTRVQLMDMSRVLEENEQST